MSNVLDKRLTVVQILARLEGGSIERGSLELAHALVKAGHRSIVVSGGGRLTNQLKANGSEHVKYTLGRKSVRSLRWVKPLRQLLRQEKVNILHARSRMPAWVSWCAWRGMGPATRPRFVTTVHGHYAVNGYSAIMSRGEIVIAISDFVRQYIQENYPATEYDRIRVVHRGADSRDFPYRYQPAQNWYRSWYKQYPMLRNRRVIVLPGRLMPLKGHDDFLRLLATLRSRGHEIHGLIVGDVPPARKQYASSLQEKIDQLGLRHHVNLTGYRHDIRDIVAASNIVLSLAQEPESFDRPVLEALYMGVPVVGYDYGGVSELLHTMFPEGAVQPKDHSALLTCIERVLREPRDCVPQPRGFRLSDTIDKTLRIYEELAA